MSRVTTNEVTVAFRSIGCRTNREEMVELAALLAQRGYREVEEVAEATLIVVNTCSVTAATESKTGRFLKALAREAPHARILVTGCLAQQRGKELLAIDGVCWVVGNNEKQRIPAIIESEKPGVFTTPYEALSRAPLTVGTALPPQAGTPTRYSIKIQEGCDFRCSYCIVPLLRGPSRSARPDEIVARCEQVVAAGYKEIVLTGTHIGRYRDDRGGALAGLLEQLTALPGDFRLRLSSIDPRDCSEMLLAYIGTHEKVCRHLHVSLQSCSPAVLAAMHRPVDETIALVNRLCRFREQYPLAGIGADFIVGFPGETGALFQETCVGAQQLGLSYAHVFRFSARPGTAAAAYSGVVPEAVKSARAGQLASIVKESRLEFTERLRGSRQRIIVESGHPVRGLTSNYIHTEIPGSTFERNNWLEVTITGPQKGRFCPAQPALCKVA